MSRILIDGYNLLAVTGHPDRDAFLKTLSEFQKIKGHQMTVVFDGTYGGTGRGDHYHTGGVEVIFSPLTVTADDRIEEMLDQVGAAQWIVVSSDRRIQSAALRAKAVFVSSDEFAKRIRGAARPGAGKEIPPWLEGRMEEEVTSPPKKGSAFRQSKRERKRRKRIGKI